MIFQAIVYVSLRDGVLDTQGRSVFKSLKSQQFPIIEHSVRVGKSIHLKLEADNKEQAREQLEKICEKLLANPVIEQYDFTLTEV